MLYRPLADGLHQLRLILETPWLKEMRLAPQGTADHVVRGQIGRALPIRYPPKELHQHPGLVGVKISNRPTLGCLDGPLSSGEKGTTLGRCQERVFAPILRVTAPNGVA